MTNPGKTPNSFEDDFAKVRTLIQTSRKLVAEGRQVDLAPMQERVRALCTIITQADPEAQANLSERLTEVIGELDALAVDLTRQFGTLNPDIASQAKSAYTRNDDGQD